MNQPAYFTPHDNVWRDAIVGGVFLTIIIGLMLFGCETPRHAATSSFSQSDPKVIAQWHQPSQGYIGKANCYGEHDQ